jgi:hypothetical protein
MILATGGSKVSEGFFASSPFLHPGGIRINKNKKGKTVKTLMSHR